MRRREIASVLPVAKYRGKGDLPVRGRWNLPELAQASIRRDLRLEPVGHPVRMYASYLGFDSRRRRDRSFDNVR